MSYCIFIFYNIPVRYYKNCYLLMLFSLLLVNKCIFNPVIIIICIMFKKFAIVFCADTHVKLHMPTIDN